jgi:hypothetical protein
VPFGPIARRLGAPAALDVVTMEPSAVGETRNPKKRVEWTFAGRRGVLVIFRWG